MYSYYSFFLQVAITVTSEIVAPSKLTLRMPVATEKFVEKFCTIPLEGLLPPLSFNLLMIVICACYGFLTRKLPENFNESWHIFVSVSTTLFLWVVFLPTYFTAFYASYQVVLLSSCLILNALITLGCLFLPKVYAVVNKETIIVKPTIFAVSSANNISPEF